MVPVATLALVTNVTTVAGDGKRGEYPNAPGRAASQAQEDEEWNGGVPSRDPPPHCVRGVELLLIFLGMALLANLPLLGGFNAALVLAFFASFDCFLTTTGQEAAGAEGEGHRCQHNWFN